MAKPKELPAEAASLETMNRVLEERRWAHLEKMAKGLTPDEYQRHIGRAAEDEWLIDEVARRLKALHVGDDQ